MSLDIKLISESGTKRSGWRLSDKKKVVAISLVKNEGDIIAAWISHICALFDEVYIIDHLSVDGTREFLLDVAKDRGNIQVFSFNRPGYFQLEITNELAGIAASENPDAWIFPLDADEFVSVGSKQELLSLIECIKTDRVLTMPWKNCIPMHITEDDQFEFINPCLIPPFEGAYKKVAIHASSFLEKGWRFVQGNHGLQNTRGEKVGANAQASFAELIHIPLRSIQHLALKCIQGRLAYDALPRNDGAQGFHWTEMIKKVLKEGALSASLIRDFAAKYGQLDMGICSGQSIYAMIDQGWTCAPLDVAHLEDPLEIRRRCKFLELAEELLKDSKNADLQGFLRIVGSSQWQVQAQTSRLDGGDAARTRFLKLPAAGYGSGASEALAEKEIIRQFLSKAFTPQEDPGEEPSWEEHIPFLFCFLNFVKPRRYVELGAYQGNSFFAACQVSRDLSRAVECIAIDSWLGDTQMGFYQENVFKKFTSVLEKKYSAGKFIRSLFDEALPQFDDGSIDLLHIDGLHTYEAVSHDFEMWLPKMSNQGIIMFHDTQERQRDYRVWGLWEEIRGRYLSFEFHHGHGLGILLIGDALQDRVRRFFEIAKQPAYEELLRFFFSHLGALSPIGKGGLGTAGELYTRIIDDPKYWAQQGPDLLDFWAMSRKIPKIARGIGTSPIRHDSEMISSNDTEAIIPNNSLRLVAFYLPQYHAIPENDRWWGKGFTDWVNVAKARPNFTGHYQPHIPSDLGFYDLRLPEVMEEQAALAKRYGINAFCFYYYWFAGKRLLEMPLERMLASRRPDMPFCLCWANENWTRTWDGQSDSILISQQHSDIDDTAVIRDLMRYMRDPRYLTVNGRPLLLVYRVGLFPDIKRTTQIWRKLCRDEGIGDIYLAFVESFEHALDNSVPPFKLGFDASVEFPPHGNYSTMPIKPPGDIINPAYAGIVIDYRDVVISRIQKGSSDYVRFRGVMPGWDNTPRRQDKAYTFTNSSPGAYQAWLEAAVAQTCSQNRGDERIAFINAWNEWAEGAHLEPDQQYGHRFLEATSRALEHVLGKRDRL